MFFEFNPQLTVMPTIKVTQVTTATILQTLISVLNRFFAISASKVLIKLTHESAFGSAADPQFAFLRIHVIGQSNWLQIDE